MGKLPEEECTKKKRWGSCWSLEKAAHKSSMLGSFILLRNSQAISHGLRLMGEETEMPPLRRCMCSWVAEGFAQCEFFFWKFRL